MNPKRFISTVLLLLIAGCLPVFSQAPESASTASAKAPAAATPATTVTVAPADQEKLLQQSIEALKENTEAVKKLTGMLESGAFTAPGVTASGAALPAATDFAKMSETDKQALISGLKWETNTEYKGFGSREAKKGGTLTSVETSFPPTLRTVGKNANSTFNSLMIGLCYESLLDLDPISFNYAPNLAKRWAIADDKVTFFYELDERAKWSDGMPVVASDIVKSWELYTDAGIDDPFSIDYWNKYEKPVALTDRIVVVRSKQLNWRAFMSFSFMTVLPGQIGRAHV